MRQEFPKSVKLAAWNRCNGLCESCGAKLYPGKFRYDHTQCDTFGGEPTLENCKVLCSNCDKEKTYKNDIPKIAKSNRVRANFLGLKRRNRKSIIGSKNSGYKRKMDGTLVKR